jgi:uncharacterized protein
VISSDVASQRLTNIFRKDAAMAYIVYKDRLGEYRWQLVAANNKIIADSGEGYRNKADCLHGISLVKGSQHAPVHDNS